ncbi:DUF6249 domain-containing protein [Microbulbifer sp. CAU 1566]|uniref:DUF6249 domain-containing protein n=1 Tax=Microbulbifer sp. CAU 1566 TaxID=2933269 RepID=UPI002006B345|nr:DUF6249 domain-containing protein [Microbulbifer sp. CAU 1566]MCK7597044.1 DUF6249 domain-containing protein [Microbulbifer sp. CAU 1566]
MRARNSKVRNGLPAWGIAIAVALGLGVSGSVLAQSDEVVKPVPPAPPAPVIVVTEPPEGKVTKQVRILRQEDGSLRIHTRDENGENADVEINLGEAFGGAVTQRIYEKLEEKGILDEKGLVIEEALESVPRNIQIGIQADLERAQRAEERAERARERAERAREDSHHDHHYENYRPQDLEWLIAVIAILAVFGTPIMIVWLATRNSYRKKQLVMENINRMVSEGRDIPPELLDALEGESTSKAKDRGFTLIAVGAAIFIWLTAAGGLGAGSLGLIPLFIGVARYINWKLDQQQFG